MRNYFVQFAIAFLTTFAVCMTAAIIFGAIGEC
jgi:hypothetical protein